MEAKQQDAAAVVGQLYAAFGRGDVEAIVGMMAPGFSWSFNGGRAAPYTGKRTTADELRRFFGEVAGYDEILAFEPREILAEGEHVTVIGFERIRARPDGKTWEGDWVHVFTVKGGQVTRFWGMLDTEAAMAARR
jgi:ketosteroid isomerase-like protein